MGNNHFGSKIMPSFQKPGKRCQKSGKRFPAICDVFWPCVTFSGHGVPFPVSGTVFRPVSPLSAKGAFSGQGERFPATGVPLLYVIGFVSNWVPISYNRRSKKLRSLHKNANL